MDFEKLIKDLSPLELMELRDQCEIKISSKAVDYEMAIRDIIRQACLDGYTVTFTDRDNPDETFLISDVAYYVTVE